MRPAGLIVLLLALTALAGCQEPPRTSSGSGALLSPTGSKIRIAMMPKKKGLEYFNVCLQGAQEAVRDLGDVELFYDGPTGDSSEDQSRMLGNWVINRYDAILIACNDSEQIAPAIKKARQAGIHVLTYDADANPQKSGREFFVNQATNEEIARALVDEMVQQVGPQAEVAIVTSRLTAPNQTAWIAAMERYRQERYPNLKMLEPRPSDEDQQKAFTEAQNIIKTRPECKGIFGLSSVAFPGVADAVRQQGRSGQIAVVGLSNPKTMRQYVADGIVKTGILWNVPDLGYLAVYAARAVVKGELRPGASSFTAGRLKSIRIQGSEIILGPPLLYHRDNIAQFDF
ncbi:MAG: substrate-binding domain-containing protein [Armatimonadetes bacterium]|nr:substrate-binding domain-containing protein [Armatimonadota bacterium]